MALLLAFKVKYPQRVFLLRGNHEDRVMNVDHGFEFDCVHRFVETGHLKRDRRIGRMFFEIEVSFTLSDSVTFPYS